VAANPSVIIISEDARELARLINQGAPSIDITTAAEAGDALTAYAAQPVLLGSPDHIAEVLPDMPDVQWVQSTWAGVTPLIQLEKHDYVLTGVKGVFGPQMSEYVIGHLFAHELRILRRHDEQRRHNWWPGISGELAGKQLGILGAGSIGRAIASKARAVGLTVLGLSRSGAEVPEFHSVYPATHLADFLENLDYLVSVLPDTPATDNLLDAETLALLPAHAVFVNVGRANVVDDLALVEALGNGTLAGAVLDVFDEEPVPEGSPLWDAPNLLMTAHMAAVSRPDLIAPIFLENYRRFVAGRDLINTIDFERGY
jgi:phosphoglycerate dehydrogenase-like enzyme